MLLSLDWNKLAPHRPLGAGDALYVPRPDDSGERLAQLIRAGLTPIVVSGPVGSGKSTELAAAAGLLAKEAGKLTCLVHLDRQLNMRAVREEDVLQLLAREVADAAGLRGLKLSPELQSRFAGAQLGLFEGSGRDLVILVLREVRAQTSEGIVLLIDGLEKASPDKRARELVLALLELHEEAHLVIVVSPALVTGPANYAILDGARLFNIRAVPADIITAGKESAHLFLWTIFLRRLGLDIADLSGDPAAATALFELVRTAARRSGGIPRTFLHLLQDAAKYASLAGRAPTDEDLLAASMDQYDSLRRLLREGDIAYLEKADNTEGLEIPLERRVRFLVHGLLLEYEIHKKVIVRRHPLLMMESGG